MVRKPAFIAVSLGFLAVLAIWLASLFVASRPVAADHGPAHCGETRLRLSECTYQDLGVEVGVMIGGRIGILGVVKTLNNPDPNTPRAVSDGESIRVQGDLGEDRIIPGGILTPFSSNLTPLSAFPDFFLGDFNFGRNYYDLVHGKAAAGFRIQAELGVTLFNFGPEFQVAASRTYNDVLNSFSSNIQAARDWSLSCDALLTAALARCNRLRGWRRWAWIAAAWAAHEAWLLAC